MSIMLYVLLCYNELFIEGKAHILPTITHAPMDSLLTHSQFNAVHVNLGTAAH